jgi:hypothetical protein
MGFAAKVCGRAAAKDVSGDALFETLTRDVAAHPAALTRDGFQFGYPTYRDGLPPSVNQWNSPRTNHTPAMLDRGAVFAGLSVLAIGLFLAMNWLTFPLSVPYPTKLAAGAPILDMRLGYTPSAVYELFDSLGQTGRNAYLTLLWTADLLLPALFSLFLSAAIGRGAFRAWRFIPFVGQSFFGKLEEFILMLQKQQYGANIAGGF